MSKKNIKFVSSIEIEKAEERAGNGSFFVGR